MSAERPTWNPDSEQPDQMRYGQIPSAQAPYGPVPAPSGMAPSGHPPYGPVPPGGYGPHPYGAPAPEPGSAGWWSARRKMFAGAAALTLALAAGGAGAVGAVALTGGNTVYSSPVAVNGASSQTLTNAAKVAAAVQPSVVSITVQTSQGEAEGSGVILRSDGVIMTNAHVVSGAQSVSVKFSNGKTANANVLGSDTSHDIAVVKAQGVTGLTPATIGDSSKVVVGDSVLAIGSPLGLDGSVTSGIVSALDRTIQESSEDSQSQNDQGFGGFGQQRQQSSTTSIKNAIQTDAAINPGNSGGALVNSSGQVIGINTAIATTSSGSGSIGVGFAISINDAKTVADQIVKSGGTTGSTGTGGA